MDKYAPLAVVGIVLGVLSITSGVGLFTIGMSENSQAAPISTETVCEEYHSNPEMEGMNDTEKTIYRFYNDSYNRPDKCKEYKTYTTGGNSPGDTKMWSGFALSMIGGIAVYRSTR